MSDEVLVSRRLAFLRIGLMALAASTLPLALSSGSAFADKGGSGGGGGSSGGGSSGSGDHGGGEGGSSGSSGDGNGSSSNSGSGSSGSGGDDSPDVAETETGDDTPDTTPTTTPALGTKALSAKKCGTATCTK